MYEAQFTDVWQGLINTFTLFEDGGNGYELNIKPLAGDLFSLEALKNIYPCLISNQLMLECLNNLNEFEDAQTKSLVPINYRSLDVEELGSVYEGLLELHPVIEYLESSNPANIHFTFHGGTERKTTGSYYTRPDLVNELIKSALIPIIEERIKEAGADKKNRLDVLLKLKVCDTAAGSGHIMLAAARTIAWYMARIDSGEENPAPSIYRYWLRQAIQHCIYAVDLNPDAVELCKLALWLEGHNSGKPLSFLDHKIRCGNSLVGVADLALLKKGIPDEAFNPVTGDDKAVCQALKKANKEFNKTSQITIDFEAGELDFKEEQKDFANKFAELDHINQDTLEEVKMISKKHTELKYNPKLQKDKNACDLYTAAFFYTYDKVDDPAAPSSYKLKTYLQSAGGVEARAVGMANVLSLEHNFFHWPLEFPDVYDQGGFDVILGNPPWEIVELNAKEYFKLRNEDIASAPSDKIRKNLIEELINSDPELYNSFQSAKHYFDAQRKFIQESNRFPDGSKGRIDLYPLFVENSLFLISKKGIIGLILPSDIAMGAYNADLFSKIVTGKKLKCFYDFENSKGIFPGVHRSKRFCLLALTGGDLSATTIDFFYFGHDLSDLQNKERRISMKYDELELFSPNTLAPPIFHTSVDYKISKKIYSEFGVFINKKTNTNLWQASIKRMLSLSDNGVDFRKNVGLSDNDRSELCRMYSGKNIFQYNHRYATNANEDINETRIQELINPNYFIETEYYVPEEELSNRLKGKRPSNWLIGYRDVTNATNERTTIAAFLPRVACDTNCRNIFSELEMSKLVCLVGNLNSIPFDYLARQKIIGLHLNAGTLEQLPILIPSKFTCKIEKELIPRILELSYTSWDLKYFADDIWTEASYEIREMIQKQWKESEKLIGSHPFSPPEWCKIEKDGIALSPFKWDEERRSVLKAELDAIYANLYGLTEDELRYILDPKEIYGAEFPGETFRGLKNKDIKKYGEYRTQRLVLEAWEKMK